MPLTSNAGTSSWRMTSFCSFWMVAVMADRRDERSCASAASSSSSSIATVVSNMALSWSRSMSNWRRSLRSHSMTRPLAS